MSAKEQRLVDLVQYVVLAKGAVVFAPGEVICALSEPVTAVRPTAPLH